MTYSNIGVYDIVIKKVNHDTLRKSKSSKKV